MKQKGKILEHPDLQIEMVCNAKGEESYSGRSQRYEPYEASAPTAVDCLFMFNIQLSEQKIMAALLKSN